MSLRRILNMIGGRRISNPGRYLMRRLIRRIISIIILAIILGAAFIFTR